MSGYNQESQGRQTSRGHDPHPPMSGQKEGKDHLDSKTQEQLRKDNVLNEEKGLIHQLPGGESG